MCGMQGTAGLLLLQTGASRVTHLYSLVLSKKGDCGSTVVKALCYKSEGRWFDSRCCHWNFLLT